jgi:DnaK suppressor protein
MAACPRFRHHGGMRPIDRFREDLLARRRALADRVRRAREDREHLDTSIQPEMEEEAQEDNIARLLAGLDERGRAELAEIDAALGRIETGDYGRCVRCGEGIPLERLEALPAATTCVECAEAREARS